jgi:hypothetical protein
MTRTEKIGRGSRIALGGGAVVAMVAAIGMVTVSGAQAGTIPTRIVTPAAAAPAWAGSFNGFPSGSWKASWGAVDTGSFGFGDATSSGEVLTVKYGKGSSAPSCKNCPTTGGAQFYTDLKALGRADLANGTTLDLKYQLTFPSGHDFGKGGKLPGLYGGTIGQESGGNHGNGWSTRYMWRKGNKGEVYFYSPSGKGFGKDLGLGKWNYPADDRFHTIEQLVDRGKQTVTVWFDGSQAFSGSTKGISGIPFGGVFFSTFYGGHDTSWGPMKTDFASFQNFSLSNSIQH